MAKKVPLQITLNGEERAEFVESGSTLLTALRDRFDDTSPKGGCNQGTCGACTVIIDGELRLACLTLAEMCDGASVQTTSGMAKGGVLHPLQRAARLRNGGIEMLLPLPAAAPQQQLPQRKTGKQYQQRQGQQPPARCRRPPGRAATRRGPRTAGSAGRAPCRRQSGSRRPPWHGHGVSRRPRG